MNVGEMFAGIGGFRLGLEQAFDNKCASISAESEPQERQERRQWATDKQPTQLCTRQHSTFRVVWSNEWDKYACQTYRKNFGDKELVEGDIRKIEADNIPEFDMLVGGFPCQSFSLAGKRAGFNDVRGTMFFEIARIAEAKRPSLLLLENVKGLLSAQEGYCFLRIQEVLDELGYDVEWQVLNSKHYGVPQNRERVFIIGHLRTPRTSSRQIFPIGKDEKSFTKQSKKESETAVFNALTATDSKMHGDGNYITTAFLMDNLGGNIKNRQKDANTNPVWALGGSKTCIQINKNCERQTNRVYSPEGISPILVTPADGGHIPKISQALQTDGYLRHGNSFQTDNPQPSRNIRRLTPTECERLQGFPDGWTQGVSDTQRYKQLGNAVTVNVITAIGKAILHNLPT